MGHLPRREREDGDGGTTTLQLASSPLPVRFLRIWMVESSDTCDTHGSADRRNCVGYAIRELFLGTASADGAFHDLMRHVPDPDQTTTLCSSVDPWHEPSDVNDQRDQVGLDLFYTSGYTRGLPAMIPVAMLYGTPEDSAAEIAYLEEARLSDLVDRDGRGARRPVHAAGGLRRALPAMGHGAAPRGPGAQAGRTRLRRRERGHPGLAGRARQDLVAGPLRRLPEEPRPDGRSLLHVVRALPLRAVRDRVEPPLRRARLDPPHHAGVARRRPPARTSPVRSPR